MSQIIKAARTDKSKVLEILTEAFWNDPHVTWFTGKGRKRENRIRAMMSHAFEASVQNGDVYISEDGEAAAIWKNNHKKTGGLVSLWENIKFIFTLQPKKIKAILELDKRLQKKYPQDKNFFYLFIIGTSLNGRGKGLSSALMNEILGKADQRGIPTYLETATEKNLDIYARKGFSVYDTIELKGEETLKIYLLRREPLVSAD